MFMDSNNQYFENRYTTKFTDVPNEIQMEAQIFFQITKAILRGGKNSVRRSQCCRHYRAILKSNMVLAQKIDLWNNRIE